MKPLIPSFGCERCTFVGIHEDSDVWVCNGTTIYVNNDRQTPSYDLPNVPSPILKLIPPHLLPEEANYEPYTAT